MDDNMFEQAQQTIVRGMEREAQEYVTNTGQPPTLEYLVKWAYRVERENGQDYFGYWNISRETVRVLAGRALEHATAIRR